MAKVSRDLEVVDLRIDVIERDAPLVPVNDQRRELGGHTRQGVLRVRTELYPEVVDGLREERRRTLPEQVK